MKISLTTVALALVASAASADPLNCSLTAYKAAPGLTAAVDDKTLAVTWDGDNGAELRLRFGDRRAARRRIRELAVRKKGGQWATLATNVTPEFRVVSGMRRITQQQLRPDSIQALGGTVSPKVMEMYKKDDGGWIDQAVREGQIKAADVERWKWEAFWDAPLYVEGSGVRPPTHATSIPPMNGIFGQKGLPRTPDEITRATASYHAHDVRGEEQRRAPRDHVPRRHRGSLCRPAAVRRVQGIEPDSSGRDRQDRAAVGGVQVRRRAEGAADSGGVARRLARPGRPLAGSAVRRPGQQGSGHGVEQQSPDRRRAAGGSIAAFPPPHSFFGARESNQILGDNYYRKDSRHVVRVRDPAGRKGRGSGIPPQLRAHQRAARHVAADAGLPLHQCRSARRRRSMRRSPSPTATPSSRCRAIRSWARTITSAWCRASRSPAASTTA